jgi:hypothetical protein
MDIIEPLIRGLLRLFFLTLGVPVEQWGAFHWGTVVGVAAVAAFALWAAFFGRRPSKAADPEEARIPTRARRSKPADVRDEARPGLLEKLWQEWRRPDFHGERAGMFFRIGYLLAILVPLPMETEAGVLVFLTVCGTWLIVPIGLAKTGIMGESIGIVLAVFAWIGRFAGPPTVSWLFPEAPADDLWRVLGASTLPVACAILLTVLKAIEGIDRVTF